ncbi:hypothetical protein GCM10023063_17120 [Arthrobacter methylotrophus]|uniref:Uncharacterized protein n=1 Tax=Arthrobacter methylotrophus TaxID=121291 RepID=A0ABV5URE7_9MICC
MAGLKTKPEYEGLAEAVSLGIALLKKAKQNTWPELVEAMGSGNLLVIKAFKAVDLTDAQLETVNMWQHVLNLVKVNPAVIPVICPACEHYVLTADTAPTRCMVTAGCEGKPFKVTAATATTATKTPAGTKASAPAPKRAAPTTKADVDAAVAVLDAVTKSVGEFAEASAAAATLEGAGIKTGFAETAPARTAPVRKAPAARASSKPAPEHEHIPDDIPEPLPVADAEPPAGPVAEEVQPSTTASAEPIYDVVLVADDEDPFA